MKTTTEEAENVKKDYGHAYVPEAQKDVTFSVTTIGSNEKKEFDQVLITEIIEARLAEIFDFVRKEIRRMGFARITWWVCDDRWRREYAWCNGSCQRHFPDKCQNILIPTYIGVREPQFTVGLGTLQFAHRNAKIQGKVFQEGIGNLNQAEPVPSIEKREKPRREQKNKPKKEEKEPILKKLQNYFFD